MDKVKIDGKDCPVCFGWNAYKEYECISGKSIFQFTDTKDFSATCVLQLSYVGLLYGAKKDGGDTNFTIENVGDWLDRNEDVATEIIEIYVKSMPIPGKKK